MKKIKHGAIPKWYDKNCEVEALFNDDSPNAKTTNSTIEKILKKYKVKTVLDLTCGTGSQVFWLAKQGYKVVGCDINAKMLQIAKNKNQKRKLNVKFVKGDMRTAQLGKFDAAITIFLAGDNITKLTIDIQKKYKNATVREIQYSTINDAGILASYDIYHKQVGLTKPKISKAFQTLQVYSAKQLNEMLSNNGFKVLRQCSVDGSRFYENKTERILTIAQKQ